MEYALLSNFDLFLRNFASGTLILHVLFYKKLKEIMVLRV